MKLPELLLGSPRPAVVGVLGSGGKTSTIALLAAELASGGARVLVSTSTKVHPFPGIPLVEDPAALPDALASPGAVFLGRRLEEDGKLAGPTPLDLSALRKMADIILIEADGARGRPLKIHLPHDPLLPPGTGLALMLLGAKAVGRPAGEETVHRLVRAPERLGLRAGDLLRPETIAAMALSSDGYLGQLGGARLRILVNQADENPAGARDLAAALRRRWTGPIIVGSALRGEFTLDAPAKSRPALLMLAAGLSRRWPGDKLTARLGRRSVLEWSLSAWRDIPLEQRILVCGAGHEASALAEGFRPVLCERPERGMSESIRSGLRAMSPDADGLLIALADMPALRPSSLRALLARIAEEPDRPLRPRHGGRPGHPVYLPRDRIDEIAALTGDRGARDVIESWRPNFLDLDDAGVVLDLDHPGDAARLECLLMEEHEDDEAR